MIIETERLILRNFKPSDLEDYWEYVSMPNVGPQAGWPAYTDKNKAEERLLLESEKEHQFAIVFKADNKVIGSIELMDCKLDRYPNLNIEPNAKEIGFVLSENYWKKGIMTEAAKALVDFAFNVLDVDVIYIGHAEANVGSGKVQDKVGFKVIGTLPNYRIWTDGQSTNLIERKLTKNEWLELNK